MSGTLKVEYDENIKVSKKSQIKINRMSKRTGKGNILAITIPYCKVEFGNVKIEKNNDSKIKITNVDIKVMCRQEITICSELPYCAYIVVYAHENEHILDNISVINDMKYYIESDSSIMENIELLSEWNSRKKASSISTEIALAIQRIFGIHTTQLAKKLDTNTTYLKLEEDICTSCHIFSIADLFLQPLLGAADSLGILSIGQGKRKGSNPRSSQYLNSCKSKSVWP